MSVAEISIILSAVGVFIGVLFENFRKSRCTHVSCCCIDIDREILENDPIDPET